MPILPIVARELSVQARRRSTYWVRVAASGVAGLLMLWFLFLAGAPASLINQGRALFLILSFMAFLYCLLIGPFVTADCLSEEKRDGTLGLLFLTDLKGHDVIMGKLASSSIHAIYGLLAIVPMLSVALLFGGVAASEIARGVLVFGNTLFFSLSAAMFVSTISQNERKAFFGSVLLVIMVAVGPYEIAYFLAFNNFLSGTGLEVEETILAVSPYFAFTLSRQPVFGATAATAFYSSLAQTHALSWVLFGLSCLIVPHVCKDRPRGRRRARWAELWRRWSDGGPASRALFRRRLLDRNPCCWLSSRHRLKTKSVWVLIVPLAGIGLWIYLKYPLAFYEAALFLLLVIAVLLKVWFAGEVCNRWIEDRRCGALELLLCAPLGTNELVHGQTIALRRQFGWPAVAVLGLAFLAWLGILRSIGAGSSTQLGRTWLLMSMPVLLADLVALRWIGMWLSLRARGLNRAVAGTLFRVLCLRWLLYALIAGVGFAWAWTGLGQLPFWLGPFVWLVLALMMDCVMALSARRKFLRHFRTVAANPSEYNNVTHDPIADTAAKEAPSGQLGVINSESPRIKAGLWSRRRKRTFLATALLIVILVWPLSYRYSLTRKIEHRLAAAQRMASSIRTQQLDSGRAPTTNETDAADLMERVFPSLFRLFQLPLPIQNNLPGFRAAFPVAGQSLSLAMKEAIGSALSSNRVALAIIHAAPSLRAGRYALDWKSPKFGIQSQSVWMVSELLGLEAVLRIEEGNVEGALDSLHRLLDLGQSINESGAMFPHVRLLCFARALAAMERLVTRHSLADADLKALERSLNEVDARVDLQRSLEAMKHQMIEFRRLSPKLASAPGGGMVGTPPPMDVIRMEIQSRVREWSGANDRSFIVFLDAIDEFKRIAELPWPERFRRAQELGAKGLGFMPNNNQGFPWNSRNVLQSVITPNAELEARRRAALTCLAIEQFRLRHAGKLPDKLEELTPVFISEVFQDPFDGEPLRYARLSNGYRVYSVGSDGVDQGGIEAGNRWTVIGATGLDLTFSVAR